MLCVYIYIYIYEVNVIFACVGVRASVGAWVRVCGQCFNLA